MELLINTLIFIAIISALFVISASNPIHSVFSLIRLFVRSTRLLFTLQADFLRILLLVVYVGAIAVLFLFVIMMLHLNILAEETNSLFRYLPIGRIVGFLFLLNFFAISNDSFENKLIPNVIPLGDYLLVSQDMHSINIFADVLYSKYSRFFLIRSLILFVAMIGAIVITHDPIISKNKKQNPNNQLIRKVLLKEEL